MLRCKISNKKFKTMKEKETRNLNSFDMFCDLVQLKMIKCIYLLQFALFIFESSKTGFLYIIKSQNKIFKEFLNILSG